MRGSHYIYVALCMMLLGVVLPDSVMAQYYPERKMVREGNELFKNRNYRRSLNSYNNALDHDSLNYEALYNRANAYYQATANKAEGDDTYDFKTSNAYYEQIVADTLLSDKQRAELYRNLGESLFTQQEYEAALNSFRESLRLNPDDKEVKYNYVLTKRIVDQKRAAENQNQDQNQDPNQNQDQNQNGKGDNNQDNQNPNQNEDNKDNGGQDENQGDENQDEQNGGQDDQQDKGGQDEQDGAPQPKELSPEKERMLDAIQAEEDKTQEKLNDDKKRGVIIPGKKNW
ncbi:MAG: tetratricopeptide repeat protein [Alistipes sp.]|nr:tetratricopeptide repeat protein [Alistipes sp.]